MYNQGVNDQAATVIQQQQQQQEGTLADLSHLAWRGDLWLCSLAAPRGQAESVDRQICMTFCHLLLQGLRVLGSGFMVSGLRFLGWWFGA